MITIIGSKVSSTSPDLTVPGPKDFGGFWRRLAAYMIDSILLGIVNIGVIFLVNGAYGKDIGTKIGFVATLFLNFIYFSFLQAHFEGSIGKRAMGLRLVTEDLEKLGAMSTLVRYLVLGFGIICAGLGFFSISRNKRKQGWHDLAAKSFVVKKTFLTRVRSSRQLTAKRAA